MAEALLVMDVQNGILDRFDVPESYLDGVVAAVERADRDYRLIVLEDLCLNADEEVHRVLTQKVFVRQADVIRSADWRPASGATG